MQPARRVLGLGIACLLASGVSACSDGDAEGGSASCAGQVLTVTPTSVPVGGSVTVHGKYYVNGCEDVSEDGSPSTSSDPMTDVPLTLSGTAGETQELAKLDATGDLGQIESSVTLPKGVQAGTVTLRLGDAEAVTLSITS